MRALGRQGVADLVEGCCALARQASEELARHPDVEILNDVVLNQVLFRPKTGDAAALAAAVQAEGTCWVGTTVWQDRPAVRLSVSNHATTAADVTRSTGSIIAQLERLSRAGSEVWVP